MKLADGSSILKTEEDTVLNDPHKCKRRHAHVLPCAESEGAAPLSCANRFS